MLLDEYLPYYHFTEKHIINIKASPDQVLLAIHEITPGEISILFSVLFFFRNMPAKILCKPEMGFAAHKPLMAQLEQYDFKILETPNFKSGSDTSDKSDTETGNEIVFGVIGQFWKIINEKSHKIKDSKDFKNFNTTDFGKVAANFHLSENVEGVLLSTETRIWLPDEKTKKKFGRYWMVIHPGSAIIRHIWLKAIKKRAEK